MVMTKLKLASVVVLVGASPRRRVFCAAGSAAQAGQGVGPGQVAVPGRIAARRWRSRQDSRLGDTGVYQAITCADHHASGGGSRRGPGAAGSQLEEVPGGGPPGRHPCEGDARCSGQRLDRIDRVLVDVVETYPTMVDFSGGPAGPTIGAVRRRLMRPAIA